MHTGPNLANSEDEGGDYGEYEELLDVDSDVGTEDILAEPEAADETGAKKEEELLDDDLGSDENEGTDGEGAEDAAPELAEPAAAARKKADPITRISNKHRAIRIVPDDERVTDHRLHRSEAALVIATRAAQISKSAASFTDATGLHDPCKIAVRELYERRCPLRLRRQVGVGPNNELIVEDWNVRQMVLPADLAHDA